MSIGYPDALDQTHRESFRNKKQHSQAMPYLVSV